jgi:hypothetical protein
LPGAKKSFCAVFQILRFVASREGIPPEDPRCSSFGGPALRMIVSAESFHLSMEISACHISGPSPPQFAFNIPGPHFARSQDYVGADVEIASQVASVFPSFSRSSGLSTHDSAGIS